MGRKKKIDKNNRTERVTIRFTEKEHHLLKKRAKKADAKIADYIRRACFSNSKSNKSCDEIYIVTIAQDMCNYIEEKYAGDEKMEGWCEDIWEHL